MSEEQMVEVWRCSDEWETGCPDFFYNTRNPSHSNLKGYVRIHRHEESGVGHAMTMRIEPRKVSLLTVVDITNTIIDWLFMTSFTECEFQVRDDVEGVLIKCGTIPLVADALEQYLANSGHIVIPLNGNRLLVECRVSGC